VLVMTFQNFHYVPFHVRAQADHENRLYSLAALFLDQLLSRRPAITRPFRNDDLDILFQSQRTKAGSSHHADPPYPGGSNARDSSVQDGLPQHFRTDQGEGRGLAADLWREIRQRASGWRLTINDKDCAQLHGGLILGAFRMSPRPRGLREQRGI
jgi:hypothetical protein